MRVSREGAYPEEERLIKGDLESHYCYSEELVKEVIQFFAFSTSPHIVDLGAGMGSLSNDFMNALPLARITAIDPFIACHRPHPITRRLEAFPTFHYRQGAAEWTGLTPMSVDLIICGQAFSDMRMEETIQEAQRILRPGCGAALFFIHGCDRACSGLEEFVFELELPPPPTPFMEQLWKLIGAFYTCPPLKRRQLHALDILDPDTSAYKQAMRTTPVMRSFFLDGLCTIKTVCELWGKYNFVELCQFIKWTQDAEDAARQEADEKWKEFCNTRDRYMENKLKELFDKYSENGTVDFYHYVTVFYGYLTRPFLAGMDVLDMSALVDT